MGFEGIDSQHKCIHTHTYIYICMRLHVAAYFEYIHLYVLVW